MWRFRVKKSENTAACFSSDTSLSKESAACTCWQILDYQWSPFGMRHWKYSYPHIENWLDNWGWALSLENELQNSTINKGRLQKISIIESFTKHVIKTFVNFLFYCSSINIWASSESRLQPFPQSWHALLPNIWQD
jgi:hypothetical protein